MTSPVIASQNCLNIFGYEGNYDQYGGEIVLYFPFNYKSLYNSVKCYHKYLSKYSVLYIFCTL